MAASARESRLTAEASCPSSSVALSVSRTLMMASLIMWRTLSSSLPSSAAYSSRLMLTGSVAFNSSSCSSVMFTASGHAPSRSSNSWLNTASIFEETLPTTEKSMLL